MKSISIGRQPVLDENLNLCSYEVLYQGSKAAQSRYTSASIINNVLNKFGKHSLLGERKAFVKIDEKFLLHDIIFSIPKDFFIFSLVLETNLSPLIIERMEQLSQKGYLLSLDNFLLEHENLQKYAPIMPYLSFVKVNIDMQEQSVLASCIKQLQLQSIKVVADNITSTQEYEHARLVGCEWFQGYFFAEPQIVENAKYEPSRMAILKLYNLIMQDVNIDEITQEFENYHEITLQLLQFINSGAFHFKNKIASVHHVLTLVGRIPLGQWLMLMIYSKSVCDGEQSPLMLMVKNRTSLMEGILQALEHNVRSNMLGEAYFVGVLSLMDTIYQMKLEDVLKKMNISEEVELAILEHKGILGEILALVKDIEVFSPESIHNFEKKYHLETGCIEKVVVKCMHEVNEFESLAS